MNNYKIKLNNEAESREAQELFFELGCKFSLSDEDKLIRTSEFFNFPYFLGAFENGQMCFMDGKSEHQELTLPQLRDMVAAHRKPTEQGLISGADALRALADGKEVERKLGIGWCNDVKKMSAETILHGVSELRIKPRTITLNVEIPAPFEPKEGEEFFILAPLSVTGYTKVQGITTQALLDEYVKLGAWRTEEEIKQVVEALRGGIKG